MEIQQRSSSSRYVFTSPVRERYFTQFVPLHLAALKGDSEVAERLLLKDPSLFKARITEGGETALHIAALEGHYVFVSNLLKRMKDSDLEILNKKGSTALCFAASAGNLNIVKLMVDRNPNLPTIRGADDDAVTPLYMAAFLGHTRVADYLFPLSGFQSWTEQDQITLLTTVIDSQLYGLAVRIGNQYKSLVVVEDKNGETPLQVLARKPLVFCCSNNTPQGIWGSIARTILPCMKVRTHDVCAPCDAYTLFDFLWNTLICQEDIETARLTEYTARLFFIAAEAENEEFLVELIRRYPDFLYKVMNGSKYSIFHIAVLHRYVQVFNLFYELRGTTDMMATYVDEDDNNMLHLAAKLAPKNQLSIIPGAALQMQREVLWYKEVEKIVQPSYRNKKNALGQKPWDLFLSEHEDLMKQGEKMMKQTAKSCMFVTMLIATVVFTAAFTVPGGYDNQRGTPILKNEKLFVLFPISEAVATLSSLTSMLMFLSILTSRYSGNDFLNSLPFWMVVGVAALFVSIVAMMVAFCTCLVFYQHGFAAVTVLLVLFATVPIMFVVLKYPLLVTILRCTYGCKSLFRSNSRLLS